MKTMKDNSRVELAVIQVDYTIKNVNGGAEKPLIHIIGKTASGDKKHVEVHGFKPYFYVPQDSMSQAREHSCVQEVVGGFESIKGKKMAKVVTTTPGDVKEIRDNYEHYEGDILFPNRFLIDKNIRSGISVPIENDTGEKIIARHTELEPASVQVSPDVHYMDIEVEDRNGFPTADEAEEQIICVTSYDSGADEYIVWLVSPPSDGNALHKITNYDTVHKGSKRDIEVRQFDREEEMLTAYLKYIQKTNPDILTGWNFEFDSTYIVRRLDQLNANCDEDLRKDRLSPIGETWRSSYGCPNIKGRVVFDLLDAYKRQQFTEKESYRLEDTAQRELGTGKEPYLGTIGELWETDVQDLVRYNIRDVDLCVALDEQEDLIGFWNNVRTFVGCKIEDATTPGDAVDMYVLQQLSEEFVLPSKGGFVEKGAEEEFEGGSVFEPITGIREDVATLDLKSLYPMAMVTVNASPETKVDPEEYDGETYVAPNGVHFRKDIDGKIREMVNELLAEREKKKEQRDEHPPDSEKHALYDKQQASIKVVMNALFGVLGWERFRLYDSEMSAAVTSVGREVIAHTADIAESLDLNVIYGDTDSILVSLSHISRGEIDEIPRSFEDAHPEAVTEKGELAVPDSLQKTFSGADKNELGELLATVAKGFEIVECINEEYNKFAQDEFRAETHRFEIEFEKLYARYLQAGKKKRYAGKSIWDEGVFVEDIDITGFEYKRSDCAQITREVQKTVIQLLVDGEGEDEVISHLQDVVKRVRSGDVELEKLAIPEGIGKRLSEYETPKTHQRGAIYANALLDANIGRGNKPKRIFINRVNPDFWGQIEQENPDLSPDNPERWDVYQEFKRDPDVISLIHIEQFPDAFTPDYDKILKKTIKRPITGVLEATSISWDAVQAGQQQTGIADFF
jgi:DNA polymerase elongation subunit (family B)